MANDRLRNADSATIEENIAATEHFRVTEVLSPQRRLTALPFTAIDLRFHAVRRS
ncbi:hypothetical protein [Saccharothrix coeruleofusca]|uniref:hypothetical protein n=1 Tax=Saccharothrix coeruleofusca TaxID=33919 RepID=UPI0016706A0A|nr:hypothetical protein [Saccharothrix coeruleofusca]